MPATPVSRRRLPSAAASPPPASAAAVQRAWFVQLFCYTAWFVLLYTGTTAYEGEPVMVKSRDLPLHWFDVLFRRTGGGLLFGVWALRVTAARLLPGAFDQRSDLLWQPAAIYAAQSALRVLIYYAHMAGLVFSPQRYARDNLSHPPHVMSDHILLGAAAHAGLVSEAALVMLHWDHAAAAGAGATLLLRAYSAAAAILAALVSGECYFTARYFHPPGEILLATTIGAAVFQLPLLLYVSWAFNRGGAALVTQTAKRLVRAAA